MCILALADDLTGALEIGAKFSAAGIETIVSVSPLSAGQSAAVVLDTETRHVSAGAAREEVHRFLRASGSVAPLLLYKKTDSTLRGNIAAEMRAIAEHYPEWSIGYAPAYPALGRTVLAGSLYVFGRPVAKTEFAGDELNPITSSSLAAMLGSELACTVFDGETDAHLAESAETILANPNMRIAAGPAGLAEMIARVIDVPRQEAQQLPKIHTCLVMNGSRHERSAAQIQNFAAPGWKILHHHLKREGSAVQIAHANGKYVLEQISLLEPDAVFVIGGDTAFAVIRELGSPTMISIAEVVPGVPVTRITGAALQKALPARKRDLILITKAGGFGDHDLLTHVHTKLSDDRER